MGRRWRYLLGEVGIGLRRNLLMTLATVVTMTVSLALLGFGLLVRTQVQMARDLFYADVEVSIFLEDSISQDQVASLQRDLEQNPEVQTVLYESKEEAYQHFQELFEGNEAVLDSVTPEILPASFRVKLADPERFDIVASQYQGYPGVNEVSDQREVLERFFTIMNVFRDSALGIAALQGLAAAALIINTIRVAAFARRDQTGIMKLVGATNWYIRLPFILEGFVAGVVGALMAGGLLIMAKVIWIEQLAAEVQFIPFIDTQDVLLVVPWLVLTGAVIAIVASFFSLRRFLAV